MSNELEQTPSLWEVDRGLQECIYDAEQAENDYAEMDPQAPVELRDEARERCDTTQLVLRQYIEGAIRKVDGVAWTLRNWNAAADIIKAEKKRLSAMQDRIERRIEWIESACVSVLRTIGEKRMESASNVIRRHKNPDSVLMVAPDLIPRKYIRVTVEMPEDEWNELKACDAPALLSLAEVKKREFMLSSIKDALKRGEEVPGAVLDSTKEHLRLE